MNATAGEADLIRVVFAEANVLDSRVIRDYLLYAADQEIIAITWSRRTLAEVTEPQSYRSKAPSTNRPSTRCAEPAPRRPGT